MKQTISKGTLGFFFVLGLVTESNYVIKIEGINTVSELDSQSIRH